jgi:hypothetical protein
MFTSIDIGAQQIYNNLTTFLNMVSYFQFTVVFHLLISLRTLRLCGEKQVFNLGILGNLAHFRHLYSLYLA